MQPWYKVTTLREEIREGRSFNPDEFAIALEQVVAGKASADYQDPKQFFDRTCFTRALTDHLGLVLRRLALLTRRISSRAVAPARAGVPFSVLMDSLFMAHSCHAAQFSAG